jgi:hypothetical protein
MSCARADGGTVRGGKMVELGAGMAGTAGTVQAGVWFAGQVFGGRVVMTTLAMYGFLLQLFVCVNAVSIPTGRINGHARVVSEGKC